MEEKTVEFSRTEQVHVVSPADLNGSGRLFGGTLLGWIDEVAGIVATRHCGTSTVTTAAIDNLQFKAGSHSGDLLLLRGYATYVGNTSMEVRIDTYLEGKDGMRVPINRAYFVMVGMDDFDKPMKIPKLLVKSESEKAEWEGALLRKKLRLERRELGI